MCLQLVVNAGILGIIGNLLKPEVDRLIIKVGVFFLFFFSLLSYCFMFPGKNALIGQRLQ